MTDYKRDSNNNIEDDNKEVNYLDNNNKNSTQYVMAAYLSNKSFMHLLISQDILRSNEASTAQYFIFDQYIEIVFQGIMSNTGAAKVFTARKNQFKALQFEILKIELDTIRANETTICFKSGISLSSISIVQVFILVDTTNFYVINTPISFLLCLKNMDILDIYLNNITN